MKKLFAIAALMSSAAFADQVQLVSIVAGSPFGSGTYTFNYEYNVSNEVRYEVGDFFTIYDFDIAIDAATSGAAANWGFTASVQNLGTNPLDGAPAPIFGGDSAGITNVTFTKTSEGLGNLIGPITIGGFTVYSQYGCGAGRNSTNIANCSDIYFKGQGTNNTSTPQNGAFNGAEGSTQGPQSVVPEPATMGMMGGALLGLGMLVRRRK